MSGVPIKEIVSFGPAPESPYSTAVYADGLIYLSGTLAEDAADAGGRRDVGTETRLTLERMRDVLLASGSSLDHVVSVMVYLTAAGDFQPMNAAYRPFFTGDPPTRTTVITGLVVPDARAEISLIAVPAGAQREVVLPQGWKRSPNPYSYAIRTGDTLFLAGLVSRRGADNAFVGGDVRVQTRTIMESEWYKKLFPRTRISDRGNRALELETTAGGVRKAVSVGGSITGFGADIIIVGQAGQAHACGAHLVVAPAHASADARHAEHRRQGGEPARAVRAHGSEHRARGCAEASVLSP